MAWHTVIEAESERTELLELPGRGCLVRIVVRDAQAQWIPATMTWCPGLGASDFETLGDAAPPPTPAPTAATPTAEPGEPPPEAAPTTPPAGPTTPAPAAPAEPATAEPAQKAAPQTSNAPDILGILTEFSRLQAAVAKAFRSQVRVVSGELGYLDDAPRVGSFSVPDHGHWVSRVDDTAVLLTSGNKVIQLSLPKHLRDDGIEPNALSLYLKAGKQTAVSYRGTEHAIDPASLDRLIKQLCADGVLRLFRSHPPTYILAS
jgi:hypothetical protein